MFETLLAIKDKLAEIPDIESVKIGIEKNLTHKQCPFIRIVSMPSRPNRDNIRETEMEIEIAYGESIYAKNNLEDIYQKIYDTEALIKEKMYELPFTVEWSETIPDGDQLTNIKVSAIIFKITKAC